MLTSDNSNEIFDIVKNKFISLYPNISVSKHLSVKTLANGKMILISLFGKPAMRLMFLKEKCRLILNSSYSNCLPDFMDFYDMKSFKNQICIDINSIDELSTLDNFYKKIFDDFSYKDIGCCSHYLECSDAKHCINTNEDIFLFCAYRQNLNKGKIFYGKNQNA